MESESEIIAKIMQLVTPFARNKDALKEFSKESNFLKDLQVASSRLVDIILDIEDIFTIEIKDDEADKVATVGDAVNLIISKKK